MDWRRAFLAASLLAALGGGVAFATDYGEGNARPRLVKSAEDIGSEVTVVVGVEFDIKPGWHIYWRNPGGAGLATEVQWRLPEGFAVGDLQWPLPIGFLQSGEIPGYGYEELVILASELRSSGVVQGNETIGASVSWLACRDICVLGSAELTGSLASLPVSPVFETWGENLPLPFDEEGSDFSLRTTGGRAGGSLSLWLQWRQVPRLVEWYPDPSEGLEVTGVTVQTRGGLTRIDSVVREMQGSSGTTKTLDSVLVIVDNDGVRRGWNIAVDVGRE